MVAIIAVCAQTVLAHHLWVSKKDDLYSVCRGLMPERLDAYDASKVVEIKAIGKDGSILPIQRQDENQGAFFKIDDDIAMATVRCDWGHRVNTTQGKKLMTRQEAEQAGFRIINSFFSTQFCKSLFAESDEITKPVDIMFAYPVDSDFLYHSVLSSCLYHSPRYRTQDDNRQCCGHCGVFLLGQ